MTEKNKRKSFWCSGDFCGKPFCGHLVGHARNPISELAQELMGKSLCRTCYGKGQRLKMDATVVRLKNA